MHTTARRASEVNLHVVPSWECYPLLCMLSKCGLGKSVKLNIDQTAHLCKDVRGRRACMGKVFCTKCRRSLCCIGVQCMQLSQACQESVAPRELGWQRPLKVPAVCAGGVDGWQGIQLELHTSTSR